MQYYLRNTSPVCEKLRVDDPTRRNFFRGRHHQKTRIMQYYLENTGLLREKFCIDDPTRRNAFGGDIIKNQRACHIILVENTGAVCEKLCIDVPTRRDAFEGDITKKHRACHIFLEIWAQFARSCALTFELVRINFCRYHQQTLIMQYYVSGKHGPCLRNTARRRSSSSQEFFGRHHQKRQIMHYYASGKRGPCLREAAPRRLSLSQVFRGGITKKYRPCSIIWETRSPFSRGGASIFELVTSFFGETSPKNTGHTIIFGKHGSYLREAAHRHSSSSQAFSGRLQQKTQIMGYYCRFLLDFYILGLIGTI
ncbi:uncharacterized protein LACBIDRAFT_308734 [Laccaria bicolor S238N-H82]|uniref:Predicted protein n=1 Tax=Laccaria bicolor (strain S238N-H82 / ATCC MYA-4686) TaxID=486041 RepID=B0CX29_LACBS|nr:uncharacterized protein LACBIDRAFT_308734 [Laccaria bicolor S238N-H82]EDR13179.1 predicted protein [Laccaria bicolor S238N-H82]|eukprot:XP_001875677.1 predicted protein [Laccaria bicolor S238N-H82]